MRPMGSPAAPARGSSAGGDGFAGASVATRDRNVGSCVERARRGAKPARAFVFVDSHKGHLLALSLPTRAGSSSARRLVRSGRVTTSGRTEETTVATRNSFSTADDERQPRRAADGLVRVAAGAQKVHEGGGCVRARHFARRAPAAARVQRTASGGRPRRRLMNRRRNPPEEAEAESEPTVENAIIPPLRRGNRCSPRFLDSAAEKGALRRWSRRGGFGRVRSAARRGRSADHDEPLASQEAAHDGATEVNARGSAEMQAGPMEARTPSSSVPDVRAAEVVGLGPLLTSGPYARQHALRRGGRLSCRTREGRGAP
jgi:hypothetical protein